MNAIFLFLLILGSLIVLLASRLARYIAVETQYYWHHKRTLEDMESRHPHPSEHHEHEEEIQRLLEEVQRYERLIPWWGRCYTIGIVTAGVTIVVAMIWVVLHAAGVAS